jgi:hypothetical protein
MLGEIGTKEAVWVDLTKGDSRPDAFPVRGALQGVERRGAITRAFLSAPAMAAHKLLCTILPRQLQQRWTSPAAAPPSGGTAHGPALARDPGLGTAAGPQQLEPSPTKPSLLATTGIGAQPPPLQPCQ